MAEGSRNDLRRRRNARPDFAQLETFLKVAETRSFAEAARIMGVSQPAVSQTIAKLEEIYGGDLFERRRGSPVALTMMGRAILPKAKLLLFMVDAQIERAINIAQSVTGSLTVGFCSGLASGPLNEGIAEFRESRPDVELRFVEASANDLHRHLNERTIDIMFAPHLPNLSGGPNMQERLWDERMCLALPHDHPLAANDSLRWADISALPIVLQAHRGDMSTYRTVVSRICDQPFECSLHDVSTASLLDIVRLGLGATIICTSGAVPRQGIAYRPIVDADALASIEAVWRREDRNPLRHRLLLFVRKYGSIGSAQP